MKSQKILESCDVSDESGKIRGLFPRKAGSDWVPDGTYVVLRENGNTLLEITYRKGVAHGPFSDYWLSGRVASQGQFHEGKQDGTWHFYNDDGSILNIVVFTAGEQVRARGKFGWVPQ